MHTNESTRMPANLYFIGYIRGGQLICLGGHFDMVAFSGGPHLPMEIEACGHKLEEILFDDFSWMLPWAANCPPLGYINQCESFSSRTSTQQQHNRAGVRFGSSFIDGGVAKHDECRQRRKIRVWLWKSASVSLKTHRNELRDQLTKSVRSDLEVTRWGKITRTKHNIQDLVSTTFDIANNHKVYTSQGCHTTRMNDKEAWQEHQYAEIASVSYTQGCRHAGRRTTNNSASREFWQKKSLFQPRILSGAWNTKVAGIA